MKWRAIHDELPPEGRLVLVYGKSAICGERCAAVAERVPYLFTDGWFWATGPDICGYDVDFDLLPSHWAELPEPPEGA